MINVQSVADGISWLVKISLHQFVKCLSEVIINDKQELFLAIHQTLADFKSSFTADLTVNLQKSGHTSNYAYLVYSALWYVVIHSVFQIATSFLQFSDINMSQGSVVTHLRCGGIFCYHFTANLLLNVRVKEFWKSVKISRSCHYQFGVLLFSNTVYT